MKDQAVRLRQIAAQRNEVAPARPVRVASTTSSPRTIAVTSGKGGVGKTGFTVNLGVTLAARGRKVVILDADLGLANVNVALGLRVHHTLLDVLAGHRTIEECVVEGPHGLRVIPGGSGVAELANISDVQRDRLIESLAETSRKADVVLIDTAAGLGKNVLEFALLADLVVVVTIPEPPAITDAYGVIKALMKINPGQDIRLVVNRVTSEAEARAVHDRLSLVVTRFLGGRLDSLGHVREDPAVGEAVRGQQPVCLAFPNAGAAKDLVSCAGRIDTGIQTPKGFFVGFLERIRQLWT